MRPWGAERYVVWYTNDPDCWSGSSHSRSAAPPTDLGVASRRPWPRSTRFVRKRGATPARGSSSGRRTPPARPTRSQQSTTFASTRQPRRLGIDATFGQSPFAIARGNRFEAGLFFDEAARLRAALERKGALPGESAGFLDLRLKMNGGTRVPSIDQALTRDRRVAAADRSQTKLRRIDRRRTDDQDPEGRHPARGAPHHRRRHRHHRRRRPSADHRRRGQGLSRPRGPHRSATAGVCPRSGRDLPARTAAIRSGSRASPTRSTWLPTAFWSSPGPVPTRRPFAPTRTSPTRPSAPSADSSGWRRLPNPSCARTTSPPTIQRSSSACSRRPPTTPRLACRSATSRRGVTPARVSVDDPIVLGGEVKRLLGDTTIARAIELLNGAKPADERERTSSGRWLADELGPLDRAEAPGVGGGPTPAALRHDPPRRDAARAGAARRVRPHGRRVSPVGHRLGHRRRRTDDPSRSPTAACATTSPHSPRASRRTCSSTCACTTGRSTPPRRSRSQASFGRSGSRTASTSRCCTSSATRTRRPSSEARTRTSCGPWVAWRAGCSETPRASATSTSSAPAAFSATRTSFPAQDARTAHLGYQLAWLTTAGDREARMRGRGGRRRPHGLADDGPVTRTRRAQRPRRRVAGAPSRRRRQHRAGRRDRRRARDRTGAPLGLDEHGRTR